MKVNLNARHLHSTHNMSKMTNEINEIRFYSILSDK